MKTLSVIRLVPRTVLSESSYKQAQLSKNAALLATAIANIQSDNLGGLRSHVPLGPQEFEEAARELFSYGFVGDPDEQTPQKRYE